MEEYRSKPYLRWLSAAMTVLLVLAVLLCLYVTAQVVTKGYATFGGYTMFRVVTGSMEPTIPVGALLICRSEEIGQIQMGDVICFQTQEAQIAGKIVTHRVVEIFSGAEGITLLRTQGDANLVADSYFVDQANMIGKVIWHTGKESHLANIFSFFTNGVGFLGCIVLPCLVLAGLLLKESMSNIRKQLEELQELESKNAEPRTDDLCGMTQEEYRQLYERLSAELMEELISGAEKEKTE